MTVITRTINFIRKAVKGEKGSVLRGPQLWNTCSNGYRFEAGGEGEEWKDVVLYNGNSYSCIKTHVKTADNYPGSAADLNNHYWRLGHHSPHHPRPVPDGGEPRCPNHRDER